MSDIFCYDTSVMMITLVLKIKIHFYRQSWQIVPNAAFFPLLQLNHFSMKLIYGTFVLGNHSNDICLKQDWY